MKNLITPKEAAEYLGHTVLTLQKWRSTGKHNLPFVKSGGTVFYRLSDLDAWLNERTYTHTDQYTSINTGAQS